MYVHMLVHCTTTWHQVCGNYAGIIVSHYHHLFHLCSLASEFLQPRCIFSFSNLTLRFQFGFEVTYPGFIYSDNSLQKFNSFFFVMSQMFLTLFYTMLFLCGKQHVQYPLQLFSSSDIWLKWSVLLFSVYLTCIPSPAPSFICVYQVK